jgi:regulator of protease activity HflC (stomatin/prohibitin superfamily)
MILLATMAAPLMGCTETINPGEVGVAVDWGQTQSWTFPEGFHFHGIGTDVIHMSTRTQAYEMGASGTAEPSTQESTLDRGESISVLTQDQLGVVISATVQFHLEPSAAPEIYRLYGFSYQDALVHPLVRTAIRDAASGFTAIDLVDRREDLQEQMEANVHRQLESVLTNRGVPTSAVVIENILLQNIDLPDTLDESIAAVQQQRQLTIRSQQALLTATAEANRLVTEATGAAQATAIQANAQAAANRTIAESLTPAILEQHRIEATRAMLSSQQTRVIMLPSTGVSVMVNPNATN